MRIHRRPGTPVARARSGLLVALVASVVVGLAGCSQPSQTYANSSSGGATPAPVDHLDVLARLPEFTRTPAAARLVDQRRDPGCGDPDSGPRAPSVSRTYKIAPGAVPAAVRELRSAWQRAGWVPVYGDGAVRGDGLGSYAYSKLTSGGWPAQLAFYPDASGTLYVEGEDIAAQACDAQ